MGQETERPSWVFRRLELDRRGLHYPKALSSYICSYLLGK